jgi:voltage-gated potassium channel Kch
LADAARGGLVDGGVVVGPGGRATVLGRAVVGAGIDVVVTVLEDDEL